MWARIWLSLDSCQSLGCTDEGVSSSVQQGASHNNTSHKARQRKPWLGVHREHWKWKLPNNYHCRADTINWDALLERCGRIQHSRTQEKLECRNKIDIISDTIPPPYLLVSKTAGKKPGIQKHRECPAPTNTSKQTCSRNVAPPQWEQASMHWKHGAHQCKGAATHQHQGSCTFCFSLAQSTEVQTKQPTWFWIRTRPGKEGKTRPKEKVYI